MKVRLLTSLGIAVFGLPLLFLSEYIVYPIAVGVLALMSTFELLRAMGLEKRYMLAFPAYAIALAAPILAYPTVLGSDQTKFILILALALFGYLFYAVTVCVGSWALVREEGQSPKVGFSEMARCFFALVYITVSFTSLCLIRYTGGEIDGIGVYYFEMIFIGAWVCDSCAYFTGRLLGRHKLAPVLSPKKTVEGSVGGMAFTVAAFALYGFIIEYFFGLDANYAVLLITGFLLSVFSQVGDLIASLIKREYGVKDYGRVLPGHGGILDRFDSILAVSSVLMVICLLFDPFTYVI